MQLSVEKVEMKYRMMLRKWKVGTISAQRLETCGFLRKDESDQGLEVTF